VRRAQKAAKSAGSQRGLCSERPKKSERLRSEKSKKSERLCSEKSKKSERLCSGKRGPAEREVHIAGPECGREDEMNREASITSVKGIGEKTAALFRKLNIETISDLLRHYPRTYVQFPVAKEPGGVTEGETAAVLGRVLKTPMVRQTQRMAVTATTIGDGETQIELVWFRMPYIRSQLTPGNTYVFYGKVIRKNGHFVMEQPVIYKREQYAAMEQEFLPVYALTGGISNNQITKTVRTIFEKDPLLYDPLPAEIREESLLCEYNYAVRQIHFPDDMETLIIARRRLVFDEFFFFILNMQYHKEKRIRDANEFAFTEDSFTEDLVQKLPFTLTGAQKRAFEEIRNDMRSPYTMQRLVQGDVGSGKTILAFLAMADAAHSGYQSAIMAPTEVLARQHEATFRQLCSQLGLKIPVVLLTGSMTARQKRMAYEALQLYPNAMVVGTHALIQEKAVYDNLALVITDEQHRFGVRQREVFAEKGSHPHILVMSATPIPRTLAIILYGDLDISVVDEVPARRLPVKNCVVHTGYRPKAYSFIEQEVRAGHQAYVICPLVEAVENMDLENTTDYVKKLRGIFPEEIRLGLLHGQMKPEQKNKVMEAFLANEVQVLVSTTVVEVGVNVPNATVMMIENAERFGLAQLHQLRGRVGRGDAQSYCIMVNASKSKTAEERLLILNRSNDGFAIASADLKLRGPGDFFGIRQSGELQFALGDIYQDATVLKQASGWAERILKEDPQLDAPGHENLKRYMERAAAEQENQLSL
jgi:ATP-dependent DNA helicase RecG